MPACAGMTAMVTWPEVAYAVSLRFAPDVYAGAHRSAEVT